MNSDISGPYILNRENLHNIADNEVLQCQVYQCTHVNG